MEFGKATKELWVEEEKVMRDREISEVKLRFILDDDSERYDKN